MAEHTMLPVHPGEVLLEDFLRPMGISQYRLAVNIGVHPRRINAIVLGKRRITADTALRLARFFNTSAEVWMNLQSQYDLDAIREEFAERVAEQIQPYEV
jgi:antitoxin HigA-1